MGDATVLPPEGLPPKLTAVLSMEQPVGRDAYTLRLLVNLVTFNVDGVMDDVPEEHRTFLSNWLMDHTTLVQQTTGIDGFSLVMAHEPKELVRYTIEQMAHNIAREIGDRLAKIGTDQMLNVAAIYERGSGG